ncbi:MAG: GNAT family N-acetyltransferase [Pirellulales bacterium]|nr:GNAT family N-acetyltransferase [Pirellulales bacterium]
MPSVLQMRKNLVVPPSVAKVAGVRVRAFSGEVDIEPWLELRRRAFARARVGVREWTAEEFRQELSGRWWWSQQRLWFADSIDPARHSPLGAIACAQRGSAAEPGPPAVHWLMVDPAARRQGIGRLLLAVLERHCWELGLREVCLETHAEWRAAVALYRATGYEEVISAGDGSRF